MKAREIFRFTAHHERDTVRLAHKLIARAGAGAVIALDGQLGAGKTRFAQAAAEALGVAGIVNSPTFTIIKEYVGGAYPFYHMDVYRVSVEEAEELGLDEYFYGEGVTLVEWASRITELLPAERLNISIESGVDSERHITLIPHGEPYLDWCRDFMEQGFVE